MFIESIKPEQIEKLEYASFPGKIIVVDSVGAEFNRAKADLHTEPATLWSGVVAAVGTGEGFSVQNQ